MALQPEYDKYKHCGDSRWPYEGGLWSELTCECD